MTMLEDALRDATSRGRLNGLTLWHKDGQFQGNARWNDSQGWTVFIDDDPVAALVGALTGEANYDPSGGRAELAKEPASVAGVFD